VPANFARRFVLLGYAGAASVVWAATPEPEIVRAVKSADVAAVERLIATGSDVNSAQPDGTSALDWAVRANNLVLTNRLIQAGAEVNGATRYGVTPLSLAAGAGSPKILEALLKAGAKPAHAESLLRDGQTLLMLAAKAGDPAAVNVLVEYGANVNATETRTGTTAIIWAAIYNQPRAIKAMVDAGAAVNVKSALTTFPHTGQAVLEQAFEEGVSYVGQTPLPKGGWTPLMYAAREGSLGAVRALIESGADLNLTEPDGTTALLFAMINGHYDVAEELVKAGANVNLADRTGMTPLYAAVDMHTMPSSYGRPAPSPQVIDGSIEAARMLLGHGADPNARLKSPILKRVYNAGDNLLGEGATSFMRAARGGDPTMMQVLLDGGANPQLTQKNGNTPLMLSIRFLASGGGLNPFAVNEQHALDAINLSLQHGLDINAKNSRNESALLLALEYPNILRLLAQHGADLGITDRQGRTVMDLALAASKPNEETIRLLRGLSAPTSTLGSATPKTSGAKEPDAKSGGNPPE
jgi:serine/threonine-protein phosphatase 6 regulatory ankyrin repeat subunit B